MVTGDSHPVTKMALFHVEALRDALIWSIGGRALLDHEEDKVVEWITEQGLSDPRPAVASSSPGGLLYGAVTNRRRELCPGVSDAVDGLICHSQSPVVGNLGTARSGAGWQWGAAFCISSGFVRLLGASEQFEIDVLKALFQYRPYGKPVGPDGRGIDDLSEALDITVQLDVINEQPIVKNQVEHYSKPALWTWMKRYAEGNYERRKIFKRVFGLDFETHKKRNEWYNKRNAIAHGRAGVRITLAEYLEVDAFVTESIIHLARCCLEQQRLVL